VKRVFTSPTVTEAHLVKGVLQNEGIDALIKNEHVSGLAGEIPAFEAWPEVWVLNDADASRAEAIIHEFQIHEPDPPEEAA
jgi:hypothetical protein